jgi:uncharacterized membrane protein
VTEHEREIAHARAHRIVAGALRIGLALSAVLAAVAVVLGGSGLVAVGEPGVNLRGHNPAIVFATVSLIVLAATPALRVLLLGILWARQRDWRFVLVALAVAGVLATSVLLGRAG